MKKIKFLYLIFWIFPFVLTGCYVEIKETPTSSERIEEGSTKKIETPSIEENIKKVIMHKMVSFSEANKESEITLTNQEDIKILQEAFTSAKKEPGVVDMADPEYKINFGKDTYFLWVREYSGTIMNTKDTHTIYSLSEETAQRVLKLIDGSYKE